MFVLTWLMPYGSWCHAWCRRCSHYADMYESLESDGNTTHRYTYILEHTCTDLHIHSKPKWRNILSKKWSLIPLWSIEIKFVSPVFTIQYMVMSSSLANWIEMIRAVRHAGSQNIIFSKLFVVRCWQAVSKHQLYTTMI